MTKTPSIEEISEQVRVDERTKILETIAAQFNKDDETTSWRCDVTRVTEARTRRGEIEPWLFSCGPDELEDLNLRLRDEYGSGRYRVRVRCNKQLMGAFDIFIEKTEAPTVQARSESSDVIRLLTARLDQSDRLIAALAQRLDQAPVAHAPQSTMGAIKEMAEGMAAFMALMPKPDNSALEMFKTGLELATKINPAAGGETNWLDVVKEVVAAPTIQEAVKTILEARAAQPQPMPQGQRRRIPPQQAQPAPAEVIEPAPIARNMPVPLELDGVMQNLIRAAKAGQQPDLLAEATINALPETVIEALEDAADPLQFLGQFYPDVFIYRPWFEQLLKAMEADSVANAEPATREVAPGGRASGDAGNTSTNGGARAD